MNAQQTSKSSSPSADNNMILCQDVRKSFGSNHVLNGLNLEVKKQESIVIIGGSGTGKSVLLKCILSLLQADSGEILVDGDNMVGASHETRERIRSKIGMLFQGGALFDSLPVWENICFELIATKHVKRHDAPDIALQRLRDVGLNQEHLYKFPAELSGGMQKRVALARAIAPSPDIIFFDEPTTGLDPIMASVINELIVKCVKDIGATALSITHDMGSVRHIADKVAMIHQGEIKWTGSVKEMDKTSNKFIQQFIHGQSNGPITF